MAIGSTKGKRGAGFFLGLLLGPIGIVVAPVLAPTPEVQAVARLGPSGKDGIVAVKDADAALWWSDARPPSKVYLRAVDLVERNGCQVTLHVPEREPIVVLAWSDRYAKSWLSYMKR